MMLKGRALTWMFLTAFFAVSASNAFGLAVSGYSIRGREYFETAESGDENRLFPVDSLLCPFAAVIALHLVDQGKISKDDSRLGTDVSQLLEVIEEASGAPWPVMAQTVLSRRVFMSNTAFGSETRTCCRDVLNLARVLARRGRGWRWREEEVLSPESFARLAEFGFKFKEGLCEYRGKDGMTLICETDSGNAGFLSMSETNEADRECRLRAWMAHWRSLANRNKPWETDSLKAFPMMKPVPEKYAARFCRFQGVPAITASPGGRLWCAWVVGTISEDESNAVLVSTSGDGGDSWSSPVMAIGCAGPLRAHDPGLWTDPCGKVWIFWPQTYSFNDGRSGLWASCAKNPEDPDTEWSAPRRLGDGYLKNKPIVFGDGRLLVPVEFMPGHTCLEGFDFHLARHLSESKSNFFPELCRQKRLYSVYSGVLGFGSALEFLGRPDYDDAESCCPEHMIVERRDGVLWMLARMQYGIGQSFSRDGGKSWSKIVSAGFVAPNARFYFGRLRSGAILLVKNGVSCRGVNGKGAKCGRIGMKAWLSDDDGGTWIGGLELDARAQVTYPDCTESSDGFIHVVHDFEREGPGRILHSRFTEADIRAGHLLSSGGHLRRQVNARCAVLGKSGVMVDGFGFHND